MELTNHFGQEVILFVFGTGDPLYFAVRSNPKLHLALLAAAEVFIPDGKTRSLDHPSESEWLIGIKPGGALGRFRPFFTSSLTPQVYDTSARLELTREGDIVWLNAPTIENPTKREPEPQLNAPLPPARGHLVGVGRADITEYAARVAESGIPMQGWADPGQRAKAIDVDAHGKILPLRARAFIIGDPASQTRVVFVVADIWSCSIAIKREVVNRLSYGREGSPWQPSNVVIMGTHTHSAPAGYFQHFLYNIMAGGFDPHVFECIVSGIVFAVEEAFRNLKPGRVRISRGLLQGQTRNRSQPAFDRNPPSDTAAFPAAVDEMMTELTFQHEAPESSGDFETIGLLNWFAIHPTNRGKKTTDLNGDNKGWAAFYVEDQHKVWIAGFANACAGDVSGNFVVGQLGFDSVEGLNFGVQRQRMIDAGEAQGRMALSLESAVGAVLSGPVAALDYQIDLSRRTHTLAMLGISMMAGSTEDGGSIGIPEGVMLLDPTKPGETSNGSMVLGTLAAGLLLPINQLVAAVTQILGGNPSGLADALNPATDPALIATHFPKPILLAPGLMGPDPWVPEVIPLQLVRLGSFAVLAVPAEVTTLAGRQLQMAVDDELQGSGVEMTVVSTYTNGYCQYVTTRDEYDAQHYEGASNLYGRITCDILALAAAELARAADGRGPIVHDAPLADLGDRVITKRRMTFRNETNADLRFRLYLNIDSLYLTTMFPGADFTVPGRVAGSPVVDRAVVLPFPLSLGVELVQVIWGDVEPPKNRLVAHSTDLVIARQDGAVVRSAYFPPAR